MNNITLIGTLTRDPETEERSKTKVCRMRLREAGWSGEEPLYVDVEAFGRQGEVCQQYLSKGRQIAVQGRLCLATRNADGDGPKQANYWIAADHIDFLTSTARRSSAEVRQGA